MSGDEETVEIDASRNALFKKRVVPPSVEPVQKRPRVAASDSKSSSSEGANAGMKRNKLQTQTLDKRVDTKVAETTNKEDKRKLTKKSAKALREAKNAERREAAEKNAIRAKVRAEAKRVELSTLPSALAKRRMQRCNDIYVEYIDYEQCNRVANELKARLAQTGDAQLSVKHREEAQYLLRYVCEFAIYLQAKGPATNGFWCTEYRYYARNGLGRRYTSMECASKKWKSRRVYTKERRSSHRDPFLPGDPTKKQEERSYGLQGCPRALRDALCGRWARDVDMEAAHPNIALQLHAQLCVTEQGASQSRLKSLNLDNFRHYVNNRNEWIETISRLHQIEGSESLRKDAVKKLLCRLMFGGSYSNWTKEPYGKNDDGTARYPLNKVIPRVKAAEDELRALRDAIFASKEWSPFVDAQRKRLMQTTKRANPSRWTCLASAPLGSSNLSNAKLSGLFERAKATPLGLSWMDIGSVRPLKGSELTNTALSEALLTKKRFELEEFNGFFGERGAIDVHSFIKVGSTYYRPNNSVVEFKTLFAENETWATFEFKGVQKDKYVQTRRGDFFEPTEYDKSSQDRTIFSLVLQTLENDILEVMIQSLVKGGWRVLTLIYDGCHVEHREDADLANALKLAERDVKTITGYDIRLLEKPLYGRHTNPIDLTRL